MTSKTTARLMTGASLLLMLVAAGAAHAADAPAAAVTPAAAPSAKAPTMTGAGAEGTDVAEVVVTAEINRAAKDAPAKASLDQVQPESIISRQYIEQAVAETGDYTSVALIAPSIAGIGSNGTGIGDYNKVTMRGFQDGQYNLTYDQISFGDTNDPTHHPADYFPASTIGAVVIDRGPGAAGDLGQANFGGGIHMFSPTPSDTFGLQQKVTYGSFNTADLVTTLNTGNVGDGAKLLINLEERTSNGELTHSGGTMANQMAKFVAPIGPDWTFTAFGAREYTKFYLSDAGPGATAQQIAMYGKNFALGNLPGDEHNYKWNYEAKATDFEYVDLKGTVMPTLTAEDQLYTYYYANKTTSVNDIAGTIGGANTSFLQAPSKLPIGTPAGVTLFGPNSKTNPNDVGGYDKLNLYRVWGNVVRINKELPFGVLKVGGITEISSTNRHNGFIDLTNGGAPDYKFQPLIPSYPQLTAITNYKLQEDSKWFQYQVFADFEIHIGDNLKLTPGVKYVNFQRQVNAANENTAGGSKNQPLNDGNGGYLKNTYSQPLYFFTGNYKITRDWSVYGQVATSFLIPSLSALYFTGASLQSLQPEKTISYQAGTVYTHGNITADFDVYQVDATNFVNGCTIPDPIVGDPLHTLQGECNYGKARYNGFEGEVAYALPYGLSVFANGSSNVGKTLATPANPAQGINTPQAAKGIENSPRYTAAAGAIYNYMQWSGSLTYKRVGNFINGGAYLPGYDTIDASGAYDFGHFKLKAQVFNLADKRAVTQSGQFIQFQSGRTVLGTVIAKF